MENFKWQSICSWRILEEYPVNSWTATTWSSSVASRWRKLENSQIIKPKNSKTDQNTDFLTSRFPALSSKSSHCTDHIPIGDGTESVFAVPFIAVHIATKRGTKRRRNREQRKEMVISPRTQSDDDQNESICHSFWRNELISSPLLSIIAFMRPVVEVRYTFNYRDSKYNIHFFDNLVPNQPPGPMGICLRLKLTPNRPPIELQCILFVFLCHRDLIYGSVWCHFQFQQNSHWTRWSIWN